MIICVVCIVLPILIVVIIVCELTRRKGHQCGIPVQLWVELFFIITAVYYALLLNLLWIVRRGPVAMILYIVILFGIYLLAMAGLTIWGYVIYFSDDNDCQDNSDTSVWLIFMVIFLFFGTILILLLICFLICVPMVWCQLRDGEGGSGRLENDGQITQVIEKLSRT